VRLFPALRRRRWLSNKIKKDLVYRIYCEPLQVLGQLDAFVEWVVQGLADINRFLFFARLLGWLLNLRVFCYFLMRLCFFFSGFLTLNAAEMLLLLV